MVDCFVALYRINHRNNHLATVCMAETAPAVFHIVLARSLYTLLTQNSVLSWWPEKETVYSLAPSLRRLFQDYLNIVRRHDRTAFSSQVHKLQSSYFLHCVSFFICAYVFCLAGNAPLLLPAAGHQSIQQGEQQLCCIAIQQDEN